MTLQGLLEDLFKKFDSDTKDIETKARVAAGLRLDPITPGHGD